MDVSEAIEERRSYRSLEPVEITDDDVSDLARAAQLAPSCFNNQPARFVFIREELEAIGEALSEGNAWAKAASMIVAIVGRAEDDCIIGGRRYYGFDIGLASSQMMLSATEKGFVAHPIAGYDPDKAAEILDVPEGYEVIALLIFGRHSKSLSPALSEKQIESEGERPPRKPLSEIAFRERYGRGF